jgi:site-specific DNA-adenine methylase
VESWSNEELLIAWRDLVDRYDKLAEVLAPLLQKHQNMEREREALQNEFAKRGVKVNEKTDE